MLIGQPRLIALAGGFALEAVWLCFAVATTAAWHAVITGVPATLGLLAVAAFRIARHAR